MWVKTSYFLSLLFAALALAPAMAHVEESPASDASLPACREAGHEE